MRDFLDSATRLSVDKFDLRGGFYSDSQPAASWHCLSEDEVTGDAVSVCLLYLSQHSFAFHVVSVEFFLLNSVQCKQLVLWLSITDLDSLGTM